jgi:predicted transcriptional regulator
MEKNTTYNLRVPVDLKKAFDAAAAANDRPASILVRDFMREYVKKNAQGSLFEGKKS